MAIANPPLRTFIAIPLARALTTSLAEQVQQQALSPPWHWIRPENWHLTLYFLGACSAEQRDALTRILDIRLSEQPGGQVALTHWGGFPAAQGAARILAAQGPADAPLQALQSLIAESVSPFAEKPDYPHWKPHITLARASRPTPATPPGGALDLHMPATEVVLYSSERDHTGSRYTPLKRWALTTA